MMKAIVRAGALGLVLGLVAAPPARGQEDEQAERPERLRAWGEYEPIRRSEFAVLTYVDRSGERPKKAEAYVVPDEETELYADRVVRIEALEEGQTVWVFGKKVERTTTTEEGRTMTDRQITNVQVVAYGEGLDVAADRRHPEDEELRWREVRVTKAAPSVSVRYQGQDYRLVCDRGHVVVLRQALEKRPRLDRDRWMEVVGEPTDDRPEDAEEDVPAYRATRLVILDRRLRRGVYPLLLP